MPPTVTAVERRVARLQRGLDRLASEVRALHRRLGGPDDGAEMAVRQALRRRGLLWKNVLHDGCLAPRAAAARDEFYQLLRHYSFRLFLRDVIQQRDDFGVADLVRYCSDASARRYLQRLLDYKLVRRRGGRFRLAAAATSFGPTLEWFVAAVLQREYGIPSAWNIRLDAARGGGDYDVVGLQEGICIYVEVKSSPPRNIDAAQVRAFFDRVDTLRPQMAVFLNDTQLRMRDKIAVLVAGELRRRLRRRGRAIALERLGGELFRVGDTLFIANSEPDLVGNLGICLAHCFRARGTHSTFA